MVADISQQLTTIRDYVRFALSRFYQAQLHYGHGTDNAWDEALLLVFGALHLPLEQSEYLLDAVLLEEERRLIVEHIEQRVEQRMPLAYIQQQAWFDEQPFYVTPQVMIPRSPLGEFIREQLPLWLETNELPQIVDLCTGSGALAILCARYFSGAHIDAVDTSAEALIVAKINCERAKVTDQVTLLQGDLFAPCIGKRYDVILSNPPYVSAEELAGLPPEYSYEPYMAFAAGEDGLSIVARILDQAADYLTERGILVVEVGNTADTMLLAYPELPFLWLEFAHGGDGVFLLTRQQLDEWRLTR